MVHVNDAPYFRQMATPYTWSLESKPPKLGTKAIMAVAASCRGEVRIARVDATAFGVFALFFGMYQAKLEIDAVPLSQPREACGPAAAPRPSDFAASGASPSQATDKE
jgi:hypothetical protein